MHNLRHTHKALTARLLCGTQQGSHVLDWEGATRLHPSAGAQAPHECDVRLHPCALARHCCARWHHTAQNVQMRRSSDVTIYGAHAWPLRPAACFHLLPNALCGMRSLVFIPRHGRLGDHHIHSVGQMPSIYGVCFHHWETQQTLDNLGPFSLFVHCLSGTRRQQTVVGGWWVVPIIRHFDVMVRWGGG